MLITGPRDSRCAVVITTRDYCRPDIERRRTLR
jgi:hypothetical protein